MHLERLRRDRPPVHRDPARLVHVAGRIGDRLARHGHAALGHEPLGGAAGGHTRVRQELRESHARRLPDSWSVDLKLLDGAHGRRAASRVPRRQVWEWAARGAGSYDAMTNLRLGCARSWRTTSRSRRSSSSRRPWPRTAPRKALFTTADGRPVEAVLMRYRDGRRSLCLSSQSGCPLTCTFCATGRMRFGRNLTASEILDQALHFRRSGPVNNAVFMGMGEPLMNLDAVLAACERLPDVGIHASSTAISTVGWLPGHRAPGQRGAVGAARALAARPGGPLRSELMPVNERYPLREVLDACLRWHERRRRDGVRRVPDARRRQRPRGAGASPWRTCCSPGGRSR